MPETKKVKKEKIQTKEQKSIKIAVIEQVIALATSGFGLVAALAWNEAIKSLFTQFFPQPGGNLLALFGYALFITILVVLVTIELGRILNLAKKPLNQGKK
ncbi:MAG: DUF5654 family protein [Candidatus Buchananbacteria bacterium]